MTPLPFAPLVRPCVAGAALAALAVVPTQSMAQVSASVAPDSISGVLNQRRAVSLTASMGTSGKALGSYAVTISWDSTVIQLDSVRPQVAGFAAPTVRYINAASVSLTAADGLGKTGAFALANLFFRIANDTVGRRTTIQPVFTEFNAADFVNLLPQLSTVAGVARVLPPPVTVGFSPDSTHQRVGFSPEIDLIADLHSDLGVAVGSYVAEVTWDPAVMLLDTALAGGVGPVTMNRLSTGSVRLTAADAIGTAGGAIAARLMFKFVTATFPSVTPLTLVVTELTAARSFGDLLRGMTIRNGKAVIGGWLRGDIDVSDVITALDAATILNGVVGLPMSLPAGLTGLPQGDADCDGVLTAKDAQIVLNHVVGNAIPFCVGKIQ